MLSVLIPFLLIFPFVFNDVGSGIVTYLPDRAGQLIVQQDPQGPIGPWTSLGVTALWAAAALLAGWFAIQPPGRLTAPQRRQRDRAPTPNRVG